jgi:hypothetical protein
VPRRKALLESELAHIGILQLRTESLGHAVQFHGVQLLNRGLIQHVGSFSLGGMIYCTSVVGGS